MTTANPRPDAARSPPSPHKVSVGELRKGDRIQDLVLLVEESNFKQTRNGKYFIQLALRDRTGAIRAVRWEATHELYSSFQVEDFIRVTGRVEEFQQNLQVVVDHLQRVDPETVSFLDFLPTAQRPVEEMERELEEHVAAVSSPGIRGLLVAVLEDRELRRALLRCPGGKTLHHAYLGGLLEHILSIIGAAKLLAKNYPRLNLDILVASAILHDIGKVKEIAFERAFGYTTPGQLLGHIALGMEIVAQKARGVADLDEGSILHIQHIVASHHGLAEHGAIKPPMTPEAIAFHFLDNLDAKLAMVGEIERELDGGPSRETSVDGDRRWTDYKPALGRRLYFPDHA